MFSLNCFLNDYFISIFNFNVEKAMRVFNMNYHNASLWHLLAGVIMAVFGIFVWFNPVATLMALALYLGIVFLVVGAGYFMASFSYRSGWYLLVGLLDMLVGVVFVSNLGVSAATLPVIFALWSITVGVVQIVGALNLRKYALPWGWSLTVGLLGVLFGFWILAYPLVGTITLTVLMGSYIFLYGIIEIVEFFMVYRKDKIITIEEN